MGGCGPGLSQRKYGLPVQATYPDIVVWTCSDVNLWNIIHNTVKDRALHLYTYLMAHGCFSYRL